MGFFTRMGERRRGVPRAVSYADLRITNDPVTFTGTGLTTEQIKRLGRIPGKVYAHDPGPGHLTIEDLPLLYAGDLLLIRTEVKGSWKRWLVAFGIRVFQTTKKDTRPSVVNHTATVVRPVKRTVTIPIIGACVRYQTRVVDYVIAEALGEGGFQYRYLLESYGDPELYSFVVARHKLVTHVHRVKMVEVCEDLLGRSYGHLKVAAHVGDYGLTRVWNGMGGPGDVYLFRWLCRMKNYPMCSWSSLHIYKKAGVPFSVPVEVGSPDDLWDECRRKFPTIWFFPYYSWSLRSRLWDSDGLGEESSQ